MDTNAFQASVQWVIANGYPLLFAAMLIEGPAVTAAGAFVAALGYMDVYIVFLLSVLGNLIPDVIFYLVGLWGHKGLAEKYASRVGLTKERIHRLEGLSHNHAGKMLTIIKVIPFLAVPGLILAGAVRMPLKKYVVWSLVITVPTSLFFLIVGYYFGAAYATIRGYLDYGGYAAFVLLVLFAAVYYGYKKISRKFAEGMEGK
ncbi:MAG: DedA family protein [Candidatus Liptonbacteria bacterium]|nr:DedA family protein [Candidatus Liptonbacteria bacterium]